MRVHNAVVGTQVQVKRDCRGHSDEFIKGGLVCTVGRIAGSFMADYELRLEHPDIDMGFAWVNASDVRRYIEPNESPEPIIKLTGGTKVRVKSTVVGEWCETLQEGDIYILQGDEDVATDGKSRRIEVSAVGGGSSWSTQPKYFDVLPDEVTVDDIQVGDSVLVGAEGAGNGLVRKEYAGLVCTVVDTSHRDDCVEISHPAVLRGSPYTSRKKYLTKVEPKPTEPTLEPDDIVELREDCVAKHGELIPQGLYIVGFVGGSDSTCEVLTVHGGYGQASLPLAKVRKVGVCNVTSG